MMKKIKINDGDRYGELVLTGRDKFKREGKHNYTTRYVECVCSCGKKIWTRFNSLRQGNTKSCGHLTIERAKERVHILNKTHGDSGTRFYIIYKSIKSRCLYKNNKSYKYYGGRGIKCLWETYEDFKKDMYGEYIHHCDKYGEKNTTIDRINVNDDYYKENCKRATREEQNRNKRSNYYVIYNNKKYSLPTLCKKIGIPLKLVHKRLDKKWTLEDALFTPKIPPGYTRNTFIK